MVVKTYIGEGAPVALDTPGLEILRFGFDKADYRRPVSPEKMHSLYVIKGSFFINGEAVKADDFMIMEESDELHVESQEAGDIFVISSPAMLNYLTYAQVMQQRMGGVGGALALLVFIVTFSCAR